MTAPHDVSPDVSTWTAVCRLDDVEVEGGVLALVGGEAVAVFRTHDDAVHALANYDPLGRASVLARGIVGTRSARTGGETGDDSDDSDGGEETDVPYVASPLYKQGYDLRTGRCLDDPAVRVPVYDAAVVDGVVLVGARREDA